MAKTLLYDRHVALDGRMVSFAGWELPVQYAAGPKAEHLAVRAQAGLFDIDHMGQLVVTGPDALPFLQAMLTADIGAIGEGEAGYALLCYADGGVVDDTFVYRLPDRFFIAINASNNEKDTRWLQAHAAGYDVQIVNVSAETYMLALQGPLSAMILAPLCSADISALQHHHAIQTTVAGVPGLVSRTGYTGEDGFELYLQADGAVTAWDAIMAAGGPHGLLPIGLAARDSLRFEACMPLYGQELGPDITPLEAGLSWAVDWSKDFCGRDALLKLRLEGAARTLVAFKMLDRGVPRHEYPILSEGEVVGQVTSGMYAPTLDAFLGLGFVPTSLRRPGTEISIGIRDREHRAVVVRKPFYVPAYRRS